VIEEFWRFLDELEKERAFALAVQIPRVLLHIFEEFHRNRSLDEFKQRVRDCFKQVKDDLGLYFKLVNGIVSEQL